VPTKADALEPGLSWADAFTAIQHHLSGNSATMVLADTSLALFPAAELLISRQKHFIAQTAWLSIGYTVGAVVGASTLLKKDERALVLVGDGGFQMACPALATLAKLKKPVTVVVFDNALYAIEQFLVVTQIAKQEMDFYDPKSTRPGIFFNRLEIAPSPEQRWNYEALASAFACVGRYTANVDDLVRKLAEATEVADRPTLIAVRIDPRSLPPELESLIDIDLPAAQAPGLSKTLPAFAPLAFN
jgi:TPP-dependent 2-oxoacid decarboxylase